MQAEQQSRRPRNEAQQYYVSKVDAGDIIPWQNFEAVDNGQPANRESLSIMDVIKRDLWMPLVSMLDPDSPEYRASVS